MIPLVTNRMCWSSIRSNFETVQLSSGRMSWAGTESASGMDPVARARSEKRRQVTGGLLAGTRQGKSTRQSCKATDQNPRSRSEHPLFRFLGRVCHGFHEQTTMFSPYQSEMLLYSGKLTDQRGASLLSTTSTERVPMYWWPSNLRWFVGQDIYARSLVVGCERRTAQKILQDPLLDAYPINPSDTVPSNEY